MHGCTTGPRRGGHRTPGLHIPPLRPLQGLRARFAGYVPLPEQLAGCTGITHPATHPLYPPSTVPGPAVTARPLNDDAWTTGSMHVWQF